MAAVIWQDGSVERSIPLDQHAVTTIGRASSAQVSIDDPLISRLHAELVFRSGHWRLIDLRSHNGTSLNGVAVGTARTLIHGDVVHCGSTRILFHDPEANRSSGSQPVTADAPPIPPLGAAELELLLLLDADRSLTTPQLAGALHLSDDGVRKRLKRLYRKFDVGAPNADKRGRLLDAVRARGLLDE